ncbi:hypothetical protein [Nostoc flagelliforme]
MKAELTVLMWDYDRLFPAIRHVYMAINITLMYLVHDAKSVRVRHR